ncbi:hypothetical protein Pfo_014789, partial [Paulownia fortunei]
MFYLQFFFKSSGQLSCDWKQSKHSWQYPFLTTIAPPGHGAAKMTIITCSLTCLEKLICMVFCTELLGWDFKFGEHCIECDL